MPINEPTDAERRARSFAAALETALWPVVTVDSGEKQERCKPGWDAGGRASRARLQRRCESGEGPGGLRLHRSPPPGNAPYHRQVPPGEGAREGQGNARAPASSHEETSHRDNVRDPHWPVVFKNVRVGASRDCRGDSLIGDGTTHAAPSLR